MGVELPYHLYLMRDLNGFHETPCGGQHRQLKMYLFLKRSRHPQSLHRRRHRIGVEDRIDPLYHVTGDFEEAPLVLQGDQRPTCSVVHADLERL